MFPTGELEGVNWTVVCWSLLFSRDLMRLLNIWSCSRFHKNQLIKKSSGTDRVRVSLISVSFRGDFSIPLCLIEYWHACLSRSTTNNWCFIVLTELLDKNIRNVVLIKCKQWQWREEYYERGIFANSLSLLSPGLVSVGYQLKKDEVYLNCDNWIKTVRVIIKSIKIYSKYIVLSCKEDLSDKIAWIIPIIEILKMGVFSLLIFY